MVDAAKAAEGVDAVAVAAPGNSLAEALTGDPGCPVITWNGPEDDVLGRYAYAADRLAAGLVVRLTSDCPLVRPADITRAVALARATGADYVTNALGRLTSEGPVDGFEVEALRAEVLLRLSLRDDLEPTEREHVTRYIRAHAWLFHIVGFPSGAPLTSKWSIDTQEDLDRIRLFLREVGNLRTNAPVSA